MVPQSKFYQLLLFISDPYAIVQRMRVVHYQMFGRRQTNNISSFYFWECCRTLDGWIAYILCDMRYGSLYPKSILVTRIWRMPLYRVPVSNRKLQVSVYSKMKLSDDASSCRNKTWGNRDVFAYVCFSCSRSSWQVGSNQTWSVRGHGLLSMCRGYDCREDNMSIQSSKKIAKVQNEN